jgi:hypothetical protein
MSTSDGVQKRNAFAACAAFRIEGIPFLPFASRWLLVVRATT